MCYRPTSLHSATDVPTLTPAPACRGPFSFAEFTPPLPPYVPPVPPAHTVCVGVDAATLSEGTLVCGEGGTYTIFASTNDGTVESGSNSGSAGSWSVTRAGNSLSPSTGSSTGVLDASALTQKGGSILYRAREFFAEFDTSVIPDSDTVTSAVMSLAGAGSFTLEATVPWLAEVRTFDWGGTITGGDYVPGASLGGLALLASIADTSWDITSGAYNDFASTGSFPAAVNKTGFTRVVVSLNLLRTQITNPAPEWNNSVGFFTADASGTSTDPKLVITVA